MAVSFPANAVKLHSGGLEEKRRLHVNEPDSLLTEQVHGGSCLTHTGCHLHPEWAAEGVLVCKRRRKEGALQRMGWS